MLFNNHICSVQSQNFKLMQSQHMQKSIPGSNISVLMTLNQMFSANNNLAYAFASEAYKLFVGQKRCTESDFQDSYGLLATYGVALSSFFFGYELSTGKMSLYTSSMSLLKQLATQNCLKGKKQPIAIELQDIEKKLYESDRIKKSIKDGNKLVSVRLDSSIVGTNVVFTPTIPRSAIDLNEFLIVPFIAVNEAMSMLNGVLQERVLRITQGDKVRVVTKNIELLTSIYGQSRAQYLVSQLPDARVLRFYVSSLGASIYTAGITNIHLENVDSIELVNSLADVDLSEIKLDYSQAKDFFLDSVKKLPAKDIHIIAEELNAQQYNSNAKEAKKEIVEIVDCLYDREVYDFMKSHPQYFNIEAYKQLPSKFGDKYEELPIPSSIDELKSLLNKGVYKVLVNNRTGSLSTIICSNDTKCLEKIYGKKYFRNYESEGNRLRAMEKVIKTKYPKQISAKDICRLRDKYNLGYICSEVNLEVNAPDEMADSTLVLESINRYFQEIEMRKTVVKQPHLVTVRSCESKLDNEGNPVAFYKNIDIKSIISITRLSDGVVSKSNTKK